LLSFYASLQVIDFLPDLCERVRRHGVKLAMFGAFRKIGKMIKRAKRAEEEEHKAQGIDSGVVVWWWCDGVR
jgi:hypothetical protein